MLGQLGPATGGLPCNVAGIIVMANMAEQHKAPAINVVRPLPPVTPVFGWLMVGVEPGHEPVA
jgi:hypothetical protein